MTKKLPNACIFSANKRAKVSPEELVQFDVACIQSVLLHGCQFFILVFHNI